MARERRALGCLERDALEIGAAIDYRHKSQLAGALREHLVLSIRLEPSRRDNQRFRSLGGVGGPRASDRGRSNAPRPCPSRSVPCRLRRGVGACVIACPRTTADKAW